MSHPGTLTHPISSFTDAEIERLRYAAPRQHITWLRLLELKTYEAAAADMGIPVGTVKSRVNRARGRVEKWRKESTDAAMATSPDQPPVSDAGHAADRAGSD